ncbi:formylglycine-generating enzyme family protein [Anabaena cylindrica FACHB-243]|uniref:Sulphatase-modifying factor protein n=1 Tax=Anabaena cylindrica (strain ATCC 27899 / PCC 7122) TaxID=272123 RepID=K9ZHV6_ANACC|nr:MULTISPECIES: formylglycine-generating enzyme family protein [Anabaena]AFZ58813.1 Sulphatase-modifying factor protein [Anabaena cylindrica PCC 7122]MBD2420799.1 formylglycine-generating enzyme family protein [Anabaena cylindrica FACHB-243]MBY5282590.1 formylglycine-generating enzyme family protein [Anabaena sp. CCAP 1446/1C]MBY5311126.1 formylglycine-generating enzyme family protein [Anabaena sp. CCAP 1446/1C]BAY04177.1 hypothetical protein NIES19_34390 [Anabaena cylindrica PCC 7122]
MTDNRTIQFTFALDDPELDDDRREKIARQLLPELRNLDEVVKADRTENFNPEAGSKGFATLVGVLTAEVSIKNIKGFLSFLSDRLGDKPIEISVKVGDKEVSIKAKSRQELLESEKIAKDLLEAEKNKSGYQLKTFQFETVQINPNGTEIKSVTQSAKYFAEDLGNDVFLEMVYIPGGTFIMGSPESEEGRSSSESPQHQVTVPPFFMGKYPVTQKQWRLVATLPKVNIDLEPDPSSFKSDNLPIECVSCDDAQEFCARLSKKTNKVYRLPSESEWEYACRGGTTTPFYFGETISTDLANYRGTDWKIWDTVYPANYGQGQKGEFREKTTDVGKLPANPCGLYDMCGNVWEWCEDKWHRDYINAPNDGSSWRASNCHDMTILRGGSWFDLACTCRSAYRNRASAEDWAIFVGLRVVVLSKSL